MLALAWSYMVLGWVGGLLCAHQILQTTYTLTGLLCTYVVLLSFWQPRRGTRRTHAGNTACVIRVSYYHDRLSQGQLRHTDVRDIVDIAYQLTGGSKLAGEATAIMLM